jgi:hypothetical protein
MITRSRYFYILYLFVGLFITLSAIAELSSSDRTPIGHIVQIAFGAAVAVSGGYGYLYPDKENNPNALLFAAGAGFTLFFVLLFSLQHFYGSTGLFSTGDSITGLGAIAFLLVMSTCLLFYSRVMRNKGLR